LTRIFTVKFRNEEKMKIVENISLEPHQVDEIKAIATEYTKYDLRHIEPEGKDLSNLTQEQKDRVIRIKDRIVDGKTAEQLRKDNIVKISIHTICRMLERIGSNELAVTISLIDKIIHCDSVYKAQFKGFPQLSYTLRDTSDPEQYILPVSFKFKAGNGKGIMKLITVAYKGAAPTPMSAKIAHNDEQAQRMLDFKRRLLEQSRKNENEKD